MEYTFKISRETSNRRLDISILDFLRQQTKAASRTFIQKLIQDGKVSVNNSACIKAHQKLKDGDELKIIIEQKEPRRISPENIPLEVVYEDEDIAVINKPVGLVTHPAPGNYEHTLVNALLSRFKTLSDVNPLRPGIVHRLDKDTSGLIVIAKNNEAHLNLAKQFAKHSIKRRYVAIVQGRVEFDEDIIEVPIGRHPYKRKNMSAGFGRHTKYAKTTYRTLKRQNDWSLLELEPFTGRTHQIRVHLAFLRHPVLGDAKYGEKQFSRLALHAKSIGFIHPASGKFVEFFSDIPKEFTEFIGGVEKKS